MPIDIYTSGALVAVIEASASEGPRAYFRDRYFTRPPIYSTDEKIYFDVIDGARRLAPYVSPVVQGKVMEHRGFSTRVFEPPYLKPKSVVDPNQHMFTRMAGEPIGGNRSPEERRAIRIRQILEDHESAITDREEMQCMEALRLGQVTVSGEGYGTVVLSFGRNPLQTIVLGPALSWNNAGIDPLTDIRTWARLVFDNSGSKPRAVYCGTAAWDALLARLTAPQQEILFNSLRGSESRAELGPKLPDYIAYEGRIGDFDFYTVSQMFQDENGNPVPLLPPEEIVMVSEAIEGQRAYAAIRDPRAGYAAVRAFPKNWIEEDPAQEYVMTQSAPLMVPMRPNASLGARVLP